MNIAAMKHYTALTCYADRDTLDLLTALGSQMPITGMLDNDASLVLYFDEGNFADEHVEELRSLLPEDTEVEFEIGNVEEQNWNAEFEQSLQPIRIGEHLIVTQSWNPVTLNDPDDLVVMIDPKMSFGTGHHESTRLIAKLMMGLDYTDRRVLDIGTGTGVLAIIAAKSGAGRILAFDNNEWAVAKTLENLALNEVSDAIEVRQSEMSGIEEGDFDIVLANMHRNIIIELLPEIVKRMRNSDEAVLLTSGVLIVDYDSLIDAAAQHGLAPLSEERENEWVATMFGPPPHPSPLPEGEGIRTG
jgi:ribosomal protein L11 methyltransferase